MAFFGVLISTAERAHVIVVLEVRQARTCQVSRLSCEQPYNQDPGFCRHVEFWDQIFEPRRVVQPSVSRILSCPFCWAGGGPPLHLRHRTGARPRPRILGQLDLCMAVWRVGHRIRRHRRHLKGKVERREEHDSRDAQIVDFLDGRVE